MDILADIYIYGLLRLFIVVVSFYLWDWRKADLVLENEEYFLKEIENKICY